jgi:hypothetical protein
MVIYGRPRADGTKRQYFPARCGDCKYVHKPRGATWFLRRIRKDGGCWTWLGSRTIQGYGIWQGMYLHRFFFRLYYGFDAETVDHLCRNKTSLNPRHMESVTGAENTRRAWLVRRLPS